jgi:cation diffusion facilitator CzcD-associated flavoprotein CzcO
VVNPVHVTDQPLDHRVISVPEVMVIGAGPAGLAAAFELGRQGIAFTTCGRSAIAASWARRLAGEEAA